MNFTLDHRTLFQMVKEVGRPFPGSQRDTEMRLAVASGVVFAIASCRAGAAVAILTEDGECVVPRKEFEDVLRTFKGERIFTVQVEKSGLTIEKFTMPVTAYSRTPSPPKKFDWFGPTPTGAG